VDSLNRSVDKLKSEKVSLESAMEMEEENIVNRMQRQLDHVLDKYRVLERRLEENGITIQDIGAEPIRPEQFRPRYINTRKASDLYGLPQRWLALLLELRFAQLHLRVFYAIDGLEGAKRKKLD